jgi:hypothetical protein
MIRSLTRYAACTAALLGLATATPAMAETRTMCAYDPAGKSGDFFRLLSDYALEAGTWGVTIELKAYTDEETAAKDYEAGQCDAVVATGVRLQRFNNYPSTLEAIGGLPTYGGMQSMAKSLAKYEGMAKPLVKGGHETVGIIPAGAVYLFVRDRNIDTVSELAGKRIATMDYDKAAPFMVDRVGAIVVPADLGSIGPKFNNGDVDICYMSAIAYGPFELHRGIEGNGGVIRAPLAQATFQVLVHQDKFPADFGAKSRAYWVANFDKAMTAVKKSDAQIPAGKWIDIPADRLSEWDALFQDVRVELRGKGAYNATMLGYMKKTRCYQDKTRAECADSRE